MENETGKEIIFEVKYRIKSKSFRNDDQQVMLIAILCFGSVVGRAIIEQLSTVTPYSILDMSFYRHTPRAHAQSRKQRELGERPVDAH